LILTSPEKPKGNQALFVICANCSYRTKSGQQLRVKRAEIYGGNSLLLYRCVIREEVVFMFCF